jgi:hypothetical protein
MEKRGGCMHNVEDFRLPPKTQVTAHADHDSNPIAGDRTVRP